MERTGCRVGQIFGYEVEGIYKNQEEINQREVKQYLSEVRPGDLKLKDQNGDKRIDQYDQVAKPNHLNQQLNRRYSYYP